MGDLKAIELDTVSTQNSSATNEIVDVAIIAIVVFTISILIIIVRKFTARTVNGKGVFGVIQVLMGSRLWIYS